MIAAWSHTELGRVVTLQRGYDLTYRDRRPGAIPVVTSTGITDWHAVARERGPGVVTGRYGTIGEVFFIPEDYWPHNTSLFVRDFHGNDPLFIAYLLRTVDWQTHSGKSGVPGINRNDIHELTVFMPPTVGEQRAIAEALSDVDGLLGGLDRLIAKKRDLKQAAMQQLLNGQTRLPGFHGEWEVKQLGDLAQLYQSETIGQSLFTEDGFPVYGANGIIGRYSRYNHSTSQITISCRGNCGTVNRTEQFSWITGNAMVINMDRNKSVNLDFMFHLLKSQDFSVLVTGSGQPQIVRGPLAEFQIRLPGDRAEQTAIAEVLTEMDLELAALEQRREKTRALKQAMMQELLTGKTRLI